MDWVSTFRRQDHACMTWFLAMFKRGTRCVCLHHLIFGSSWLCHLSRICLPVRVRIFACSWDHALVPCSFTCSIIIWSSWKHYPRLKTERKYPWAKRRKLTSGVHGLDVAFTGLGEDDFIPSMLWQESTEFAEDPGGMDIIPLWICGQSCFHFKKALMETPRQLKYWGRVLQEAWTETLPLLRPSGSSAPYSS
jgi:hypothetical protein